MNLKQAVKNQFVNRFWLNLENYWLSIVVVLLLNSCGSTKESTYFYETPNIKFINNFENLEPVLRPNDLLSISVSSVNPEATKIFNVSNMSTGQSSTVSGTTAQVSGYLVDQDGFIRFPVLGKIQAAGKSKKELREEITKELVDRKLLLDPIVDIRYLNFKVSVLGEVKNPSVLVIPDEKISLLEALGLAGDITIYGRRDNVVIIREEEYGVKKLTRLDLTSNEIFDSPYYYLKSNDIVYVEANKKKVASSSMTPQWFAVILSGLSLMVISISAFVK
ncbi:polysaccharide biosynthesis/export family protein [Flavobacteriaceae bacterium F89]|uniref:Polysaccharide biosynthesis/export family protein n=1 Tax=Cerina litoralis TaxID=2874477 RepID=A0AAE3ERA8_9FLAO|nr:polysaccharide biosynthesis/export family protein [Cerina litoralis]MCG2459680.1 polysaccharide biosynthesis/export family protein [Cerina litoralis]